MTAEQQGVSPATAGGASAPNPATVDNSIAYALTHHYGFLPLNVRYRAAQVARAIVEQSKAEASLAEILPAEERKPIYSEPGIDTDWDEDADAQVIHGVGWNLSWGCKLSIARDHDTGEHYVCVNTSGEDQRKGIVSRSTTREQIASFGRQLLNVFGEPDPRDAEIKRLCAELDGQRADKEQAEAAHDRLRADLARERAIYADSPDDRLYHAADNTWWRRNDNGWLVEAERPQLADITAERDQLRRKLDQHLADENSAQAVSDRLRQELDLQHADRLRWLCEALNVNPANETWLTAMRRVRHLRQNFSDSPRCEVAESDGWRCRLFAGHDGKHLAQMPTGERREWPFDNRLTPRYWRVGDPEPEIGTTVRYVNHATWPTQTRRTDGQWHCNADTHDPSTCTESELYSWEQITARSELMPLVEVAANSKAGA